MAGGRRSQLGLAVSAFGLLVLVAVVVAIGIRTHDAAWTAGAAAVATMIVIAYQSWQIRRSTDVTARSVAVGQAAAVEAEKTRLDQHAPRIRVSVGTPGWPPLKPRLNPRQQENWPFDEGQIFRLPGAREQRMGLMAEGGVINEGDSTVDVQFHALRVSEGSPLEAREIRLQVEELSEPGNHRRILKPGESIRFVLQGELSVAEWAENMGAAGREPTRHVIAAEVVVDDGLDNGVIDTWGIEITGTPLLPVIDETDSWRIPRFMPGAPVDVNMKTVAALPIRAAVQPQRRAYWRSKKQGIELPSLELWERRPAPPRKKSPNRLDGVRSVLKRTQAFVDEWW